MCIEADNSETKNLDRTDSKLEAEEVENKTGQFIARRRKAIGLTQKELAEQLGVTNKAVSKWETGGGMPDVSVLKDLSRVLEVSVDELLEGAYTKNAEKATIVFGEKTPESFTKKQRELSFRKRLLLGTTVLLPAIFILCMQILFLYVRKSYQIEYIADWLPWLFFAIAVISAAGALCIWIKNRLARLCFVGIGGCFLLLFLVLGIYTVTKPYALKTIIDFSPDYRHRMVLKYEKETGRVLTYQNQILWFARRSDQFPYTAEDGMKMQWLANDACAVTYESPDDGQIHQYVMTYGDRGSGITTYYVYNAIQGEWSAEGKNTAGWELKTGPEGISIVSPSGGEEIYESGDCVQFGTLALVLCRNGLPQWTLVLEEDCTLTDSDYIKSGTVNLCKVTMEKSAPVSFSRSELLKGTDREILQMQDAQEAGKALVKEMKETLKSDPTLTEYESDAYGGIKIETDQTDLFWIVRCAMEERMKLLAVNSVDVDCQILYMELMAGDGYDCVVQVKSREIFNSSSGESSQADMETTFRMMKGEGAYLICPVSYGTDADVGLNAPAMRQERYTQEDKNYHFFVRGQTEL